MTTSTNISWLAVDWGSSHLRIWGLNQADIVTHQHHDARGIDTLKPDEFGPALLNAIIEWPIPEQALTLIAGAAGAKQGWHEAGYSAVPCRPLHLTGSAFPKHDALDVRILPGLSQANPADVMRGEETQIAGYLSENPDFDGVLCLPGTHCKWAHISAGEVVSFRTFLTGELFALLSKHSVLRHTISTSGFATEPFLNALSDAISRPETVMASLFRLRAEGLVHSLDPINARSTLSGYLIGLELAAAKPYWLGQSVAVIAAEELSEAYLKALSAQGIKAGYMRSKDATLRGLKMAKSLLEMENE